MKFDHIGVVVPSLAIGRDLLVKSLNIQLWTSEFHDTNIGVSVQFGKDESGICYELCAPLSERSPISRALTAGVNIINHVAYLVLDIGAEAKRLRGLGFSPTGAPIPAVAYNGARIQFFVSETRMLIELIEAPQHQHIYQRMD